MAASSDRGAAGFHGRQDVNTGEEAQDADAADPDQAVSSQKLGGISEQEGGDSKKQRPGGTADAKVQRNAVVKIVPRDGVQERLQQMQQYRGEKEEQEQDHAFQPPKEKKGEGSQQE